MIAGKIRVIGKEIVDAKLAAAAANIAAHNRLMIAEMLASVKTEVVAKTPVGPGHFGYHLRDSYTTDIKESSTRTWGVLKAPAHGYWYEYGTGMRHRGPKKRAFATRIMTGAASVGGEKAHLLAHHALTGIKKYIRAHYGAAQWWTLKGVPFRSP